MSGRREPRLMWVDGHRTVPLDRLVERWLAEGVIGGDQAERMLASAGLATEGAAAPEPAGAGRPASVAAEALAYVGGAIVLAGCILLTAYYWADLSDPARLAVVGSAALLLLLGGLAVPRRLADVGRRLRSVLWLASTLAWTGAVAILLVDVLPRTALGDETTAVLVAAAALAYAGALWAALRYGLQQAATMVAAAALAAALVVRLDLPGDPGHGVWLVGVLWAGLGVARVLTPTETPIVIGAVAAVFGAMTTASTDAGMVLTLVTILAIVVAAVVRRDLVLLGVGAAAALLNLPAAMARWFAGSASAALALVVVGSVLVAIAVWMTRRTGPRAH